MGEQTCQKSKFTNVIILSLLIIGLGVLVYLLNTNSASTKLLWDLSRGGKWLLPLILASALIYSINPCAFSVLLVTIAFLFSIGKTRSMITKLGVTYILGIFIVYTLIGLGILQVLHLFNTPHFMAKVGAFFLVILGLVSAFDGLGINFPVKLHIPKIAHPKMSEFMRQGSVPATFILGVLVGLCEFPCTGGPYLTALGLLHDATTYWQGLSYLFIYNLIFILPLVIMLLLASDKDLLEKISSWQQKEKRWMRLLMGAAMVIVGLLIFFI